MADVQVNQADTRSGVAWAVIAAVVVLLAVIAFIVLGDRGGERDIDVNVNVPAIEGSDSGGPSSGGGDAGGGTSK